MLPGKQVQQTLSQVLLINQWTSVFSAFSSFLGNYHLTVENFMLVLYRLNFTLPSGPTKVRSKNTAQMLNIGKFLYYLRKKKKGEELTLLLLLLG